MNSFFVADDEKSIRNGLKCIIDWQQLGFEYVGEATNGEDAYTEILDKRPDLVVMDIRMPRLSGLECVKKLRASGYQGHVIILSGYSDFGYAKEAIRSGVDYYLTKPIDEEELLEAVGEVKKLLDEQEEDKNHIQHYKDTARNVVLKEILTGESSPDERAVMDLMPDASIFQVVLYENFAIDAGNMIYSFADILKVTNQGGNLFESIPLDGREVVLLKGENALLRFRSFLEHYENLPPQEGSPMDMLFIAYGEPVRDIRQIRLSYEQARTLVGRRFFCVQGQHTLGYNELPGVESLTTVLSDEKMDEYCRAISGYLQSYNRKKLAETLYQLEQYLYLVKNSLDEVKLFLTDLYLQIKEKMKLTYSTISIPFSSNREILEYISKRNYLYEIILYISEQGEMIMNSIGGSTRDSVLDDVLYYIDHNYRTSIKLESIAPLFGYNSAYLGKIFNKTVGSSFNSYVDHVRIERSKELLIENRMKVYEVAEQVGYNNVDYFHKKFKKYVGMSPAEYRKASGVDEEEESDR